MFPSTPPMTILEGQMSQFLRISNVPNYNYCHHTHLVSSWYGVFVSVTVLPQPLQVLSRNFGSRLRICEYSIWADILDSRSLKLIMLDVDSYH